MKYLKVYVLFIVIVAISGCGIGDYEMELPNNYIIWASSAHQVEIVPKESSYFEEDKIPSKVVEIAWNDRYIIAKQYGLKEKYPNKSDNSYKVPDTSKIYYWILDTKDKVRYGPYINEKDFNDKKNEISIGHLKLKSLDELDKLKDYGY